MFNKNYKSNYHFLNDGYKSELESALQNKILLSAYIYGNSKKYRNNEDNRNKSYQTNPKGLLNRAKNFFGYGGALATVPTVPTFNVDSTSVPLVFRSTSEVSYAPSTLGFQNMDVFSTELLLISVMLGSSLTIDLNDNLSTDAKYMG